MSHILHERLLVLLLAKIKRLLDFLYHADLAASSHVGQSEVALVQTLLDSALDLPGEDFCAETRFLADGAGETDAVDCIEGIDHCADGFESAGDVGFGLAESGDDCFGEVEEEGFALLCAVFLMGERKFLVCSAAQLYEIKAVFFEAGAKLIGFFGFETTLLELDAVDLDADNGVFGDASADALGDFHDEAGAVGKGTTVLVGAFVGASGEELGEEVAVGAVEFDTVVAGYMEVFCCVGEAFDHALGFFGGCGLGHLEGHAHKVAF